MCKKISNEPWYKRILNKIICKKINPIAGDLPGGEKDKLFKEGLGEVFEKQFESEEDRKIEGILALDDFGMKEFEIIEVPGHTKGSVVFYMPKEKILFSGDHIFDNGYIGRTDLPNSLPDEMKNSLGKTNKIDYEILCSGHEY